jgi:hypothetical protein
MLVQVNLPAQEMLSGLIIPFKYMMEQYVLHYSLYCVKANYDIASITYDLNASGGGLHHLRIFLYCYMLDLVFRCIWEHFTCGVWLT